MAYAEPQQVIIDARQVYSKPYSKVLVLIMDANKERINYFSQVPTARINKMYFPRFYNFNAHNICMWYYTYYYYSAPK